MKEEVITFKVDSELAAFLKKLPNRSAFIRHSIVEALGNFCPVCSGTGLLTRSQKKHWESFSKSHPLKKCTKCDELYLTCENNL
jgi:hypothetical protein